MDVTTVLRPEAQGVQKAGWELLGEGATTLITARAIPALWLSSLQTGL